MGNIISNFPSIKVIDVARTSKVEEISLRNSQECISSVIAVRTGADNEETKNAKINNYYRLPNATLPEGKRTGVRNTEGVVPNGRVMLDLDVHNGGLDFYNEKIRGHEEELGLIHAELSAHRGFHGDVRIIEGLSRYETIRYFSQLLGVEFDLRCADLPHACFLVPQADVLYDTDEYYEGVSVPQQVDLLDFLFTEEVTEEADDFDLDSLAERVEEFELDLDTLDSPTIAPTPVVETENTYHRQFEEDDDEFLRIIRDFIIKKQVDITAYEPDWFRLGCACFAVLGKEDGRYAFHSISKYYPNYSVKETDNKYDNIARHMYDQCGIGTLIYLCRQAGILD